MLNLKIVLMGMRFKSYINAIAIERDGDRKTDKNSGNVTVKI